MNEGGKSKMNTANTMPPPWYRQFWPWFLISIPLATVIASMFTIHLATVSDDGLVADNYYKKGLAIHMDADALQKARTLGVVADINMSRSRNLLIVDLKSEKNQAFGPLHIALRHPTRPNNDLTLDLKPVGPSRYQATLPAGLAKVNWKIQLNAPEAGWRLHGRIDNNADEAHLILR